MRRVNEIFERALDTVIANDRKTVELKSDLESRREQWRTSTGQWINAASQIRWAPCSIHG
ncbi:hypothetical protein OOU_Y34scaffold00692g39 [Pyricularia oryzae Y34]|uniref:Uncharacterized protein n=2 Tax=Pyricularia oryzae TaxID=318829 RepID=A0AA97NSU7_PYRO3|nr:hypothetical protein OOU_Y34scaffold00692g39 [Pyricularia oryzae Y34]